MKNQTYPGRIEYPKVPQEKENLLQSLLLFIFGKKKEVKARGVIVKQYYITILPDGKYVETYQPKAIIVYPAVTKQHEMVISC